MPQARLPDINTAFIVYRREAISSWKSGRYDGAVGALYAYNSLLPEDFQIKISDILYAEKTKQDISATCNKCSESIDYKSIKVRDLLMTFTSSLIAGQQYAKVWDCPKCKAENKLMDTKLTQNVLQEPYHLKVIPKLPIRTEGLQDRKYHKYFTLWFWAFLNELEAEAARFRDENWNKGNEQFMLEEAEVDTEGEQEQ